MTKMKLYTLTSMALGLASLGLVLSACTGGDTDGGPAGDETFDGTSFVGDDDTAGSMSLDVVNTDLNVGETTGFRVHVTDSAGAPVPGIEIACDTESGLGLVEPNTGFELTDSNGQISGVVGCEQPGSYQIGCRLPVGGNQRRFETLRCTGPVPEGFTGFPGAGGGTLGTGGNTPSGGTDNVGTVRITSIAAIDTASSTGGTSIDVVRGLCSTSDEDTNGDGTINNCDGTIEPFFDTQIKVTVTNETTETIFINSFQYQIKSADSLGDLTSDILSFSSSSEVAPGASADFTGLFLRIVASSSSTCGIGEGKRFTGRSAAISSTLGFKNVSFKVFGVDGSGQDITLTGKTGLSFGNFDNCGG